MPWERCSQEVCRTQRRSHSDLLPLMRSTAVRSNVSGSKPSVSERRTNSTTSRRRVPRSTLTMNVTDWPRRLESSSWLIPVRSLASRRTASSASFSADCRDPTLLLPTLPSWWRLTYQLGRLGEMGSHALKPCSECGQGVSSAAAACPGCGHPVASSVPLIEVAANLKRGIEFVAGRLRVSEERITFEPHALNLQQGVVEIPLRWIAEVSRKNSLALVPNKLELILTSGLRYTLIVNRRAAVAEIIERHRIH